MNYYQCDDFDNSSGKCRSDTMTKVTLKCNDTGQIVRDESAMGEAGAGDESAERIIVSELVADMVEGDAVGQYKKLTGEDAEYDSTKEQWKLIKGGRKRRRRRRGSRRSSKKRGGRRSRRRRSSKRGGRRRRSSKRGGRRRKSRKSRRGGKRRRSRRRRR